MWETVMRSFEEWMSKHEDIKMDTWECENCQTKFRNEWNYKRHSYSCKPGATRYPCEVCGATFARKDTLKRHVQHSHSEKSKQLVFPCGFCFERFANKNDLQSHRINHMREAGKNHDGFNEVKSAHKRKCMLVRMMLPKSVQFLDATFAYIKPRLKKLLQRKQVEMSFFKAAFTLQIEMVKIGDEGKIETTIITPFRSEMFSIKKFDSVDEIINDGLNGIGCTIDEFLHRGSGWSLSEILNFDVEFAECRSLNGSCGLHDIIYDKKSGLGFKTSGFEEKKHDENSSEMQQESIKNDCFYLAIARQLVGEKADANKSLLYDYINNSIIKSVPSPVKLEDIHEFECDNALLEISINVVYQDENNQVSLLNF